MIDIKSEDLQVNDKDLENNRAVETGLDATVKNCEILKSVIGQMSDGIWENTNGMTSYWTDASIKVRNGKMVILVNKKMDILEQDYYSKNNNYHWRRNKYYWMKDSEVADFFAKKIRCIVSHENRDNKMESEMSDEEFYSIYRETVPKTVRNNYKFKPDNELELSYLGYDEAITVGDAYKCVKTIKDFYNL